MKHMALLPVFNSETFVVPSGIVYLTLPPLRTYTYTVLALANQRIVPASGVMHEWFGHLC
jgi:hypothetical protein